MKANYICLLVCSSVLWSAACSSKTGSSAKTDSVLTKEARKDTTKVQPAHTEYSSAYICPSHCTGSGSDKAGTCKTCGMEYIENHSKK